MKIAKSWSSHMPMLIKTVQMTDGPILELGSGIYSTALLHWLCIETKRRVVTYEGNPKYFGMAKKFQSRNHRIVNNLDLKNEQNWHWSVVFVDGMTQERVEHALKFKDSADFVLLHDSQESLYGYEKVYPHFKFRYDWKFANPWTTVLSNFIDLAHFNE